MITLESCSRKRYPTRRDREEFAWLFKKELEFLERNFPIKTGKWNKFANHPMTHKVGNAARKAFGYSSTYNNCDLVWSLRFIYRELKEKYYC